jgi:hypothetical protein
MAKTYYYYIPYLSPGTLLSRSENFERTSWLPLRICGITERLLVSETGQYLTVPLALGEVIPETMEVQYLKVPE